MAFIMGVDGGGSKTYTVITDEDGTLLGAGFGAGANYQKTGIETAMDQVAISMKEALQAAGIRYEDLSFVQYTLAGADRPIDFANLTSGLSRFPVRAWDLANDTMAGLRSGSPDNVGVVLVCGSGTNAFGRSKSGKAIQTGGFGYLYGDFAGGQQMAIETFRAAVRSWEGRDIPSKLMETVPTYLGFSSMEALLDHYLDRQIRKVPSELTIVLHEAADDGDALAEQILARTGAELGYAANSVMHRIGDFGIDEIPLVLIGSVFQRGRSSALLDALTKTVEQSRRNIQMCIPSMEPVFGAVMMAMDQLQLPVTEQVIEKFNAYRREIVHES